MDENFDEVVPYDPNQKSMANVLQEEGSLVKVDTGYQVAVSVPKPRNLAQVKEKLLIEAREGKNDFWYTWQVRNKKTGKSEWIPPGATIGLAQALYRSYGNCAMKTDVVEKDNTWIIKTTVIDIENGLTSEREVRQRIPSSGNGNYDTDRWQDMKFQSAYSKCQRNAILNILPRYLKNLAIEAAQAASKVKTSELSESLQKALSFFSQYDISTKDLCLYFAKPTINDIDEKDVTLMRNIATGIQNKEINPQDIKDQVKDIFDFNNSKDTKPATQNIKSDIDKTKANKTPPPTSNARIKKQPKPETPLPHAENDNESEESHEEFIPEEASSVANGSPELNAAMLMIHTENINDFKKSHPDMYKTVCDELYIPLAITPDTIEACNIIINKIKEVKARK